MPDFGSPPRCPICSDIIKFLDFDYRSGIGKVHCYKCCWTGYHAPRPRLQIIEEEFRDRYTLRSPMPSREFWTMALAWLVLALVIFDIGLWHGWW